MVFTGTVSGSGLAVTPGSETVGTSADFHTGMAVLYQAWEYASTQNTTVISGGTYPNFTLTNTNAAIHAGPVTMTAIDRYLCSDGQPAFSRVADPLDPGGQKKCWRFRVLHDDYRPGGQSSFMPAAPMTSGTKKVLVRFGDDGVEPSRGQGTVQDVGTYYLDIFALHIPAATKDLLNFCDEALIWQHKDGAGAPGLSINVVAGTARNNGPLLANRMAYGSALEARLALSIYGENPTAAQAQRLLVANFPTDRWIYVAVRSKPNRLSASGAHSQVWVASGDAAAAKLVDDTFGNADGAGSIVNRQWGWYPPDSHEHIIPVTGINDFPNLYPWWESGDEINVYYKGPYIAPQWRADQEPTLATVDQWFDILRGR